MQRSTGNLEDQAAIEDKAQKEMDEDWDELEDFEEESQNETGTMSKGGGGRRRGD